MIYLNFVSEKSCHFLMTDGSKYNTTHNPRLPLVRGRSQSDSNESQWIHNTLSFNLWTKPGIIATELIQNWSRIAKWIYIKCRLCFSLIFIFHLLLVGHATELYDCWNLPWKSLLNSIFMSTGLYLQLFYQRPKYFLTHF